MSRDNAYYQFYKNAPASPAKSPPSKDTVQLMTLKQLHFGFGFWPILSCMHLQCPRILHIFIWSQFYFLLPLLSHSSTWNICWHASTIKHIFGRLSCIWISEFCLIHFLPWNSQINLPFTISAMYQDFMTIWDFDENRLTYISLCLFVAHRCS